MTTKTKPKRHRVKRKLKRQPTPAGNPTVPPLEDQLMIRTSERSSFKTCRHQWQWAYIDKMRSRQAGPALRFGDLIHKALEAYYKPGIRRGPKPAGTFDKLYQEDLDNAQYEFGFSDEDGVWMEAREIGVDLMEHYVEHYGKDDEWEVISSEQTFQVPVFEPCQGCGGTGQTTKRDRAKYGDDCPICKGSSRQYLFTYVGTLDGVWKNRMSESVSIVDHKTTSGDPIAAIRNPGYTGPLDQQASAYWTWGVDYLIAKKILMPRHIKELDGMLYNYLRKAVRDPRPQNKEGQYLNKPTKKEQKEFGDNYPGSISKKQPPAWFHREPVYRSEGEREITRARAVAEVKEMIELRAGPRSNLYKAPHWINCRGCEYRDICEIHESGGDWESFAETAMGEWNPYDAHEIEQEGKNK